MVRTLMALIPANFHELRFGSAGGVPQGCTVILFFGFIKPYKGLDLLLKAPGRLDPLQSVHVLVTGSGSGLYARYVEQCQRLMSSPSIEDRVTAGLPLIEDEEIRELFGLSGAAALPYWEAFTS